MTLEELEKSAEEEGSLAASEDTDDDFDADAEQAVIDIKEAIRLLTSVKKLVDYLGDPDFVKTITKRERKSLNKVSTNIGDYLNNTVPMYEDVEDE